MKNLKILLLSILATFAISCGDDNEGIVNYSGSENRVAFSFGNEQRMVVKPEAGSANHKIYFGTFRNVNEDHQVKLVLDETQSTAVQGVDFDLVESTVVLKSGTAINYFEVIVHEAPAITLGKKAFFKLESETLDLVEAKSTRTVEIGLSCQVDLTTFPLNYSVDVFASGSQVPTHTVVLEVVAGEDNTFKFANLWSGQFVNTLTGTTNYTNQFPLSGNLIINCDDTVNVVSSVDYSEGGTGIYDPFSGMIDVTVEQGIFTTAFTVNCIMMPVVE